MPDSWRVVIADDEPAARRGVRQLLAPFADFTVVAECRDGRETLRAMDAWRPHVVFLDVQMPELGGFGVAAHRPRDAGTEIVFLTAYDQYAIKAFEAEAADYLVKPVSDARFLATIERLRRRLGAVDARATESLFLPTQGGGVVVAYSEIDWIASAGNYARVWVGARSHLIRESLDELEARVGEHGFVRAHRQALVRLAAVRALETHGGALVAVLSGGIRVPIARRKRNVVRDALRGAP